eukprot:109344-Alexandrium_andersonii.AAC.1
MGGEEAPTREPSEGRQPAAACVPACARRAPVLCAPSHSRPDCDTGSPMVLHGPPAGSDLAALQKSSRLVE